MSIRFNIQVDAQPLIKRARELTATLKQVQRPTREIALRLLDNGRGRLQARPPGKYPPVRTGLLARSLYARPTTATEVVVASQFPYARIQQQGGIVLPTHGKCLAIPLTAALKRAGTWPRDWPRGALKFIPINNGNTVGMLVGVAANEPGKLARSEKATKRRAAKRKEKMETREAFGIKTRASKAKAKAPTSEPLYLLVKSSLIPTQPYIIWDAEMSQITKDAWARHLKGTAVG